MTIEQLPPHNREAEEAVLGSLLIDPDAWLDVASKLTASDFYVQQHGMLWTAINRLVDRGAAVDTLTAISELKRLIKDKDISFEHLEAWVVGLSSAMPTSLNILDYATEVKETSILRDLLRMASYTAQRAYDTEASIDDVLGDVTKALSAVLDSATAGGEERSDSASIISDIVDELDRAAANDFALSFDYPLPELRMFAQQLGVVTLIAARTKVGKTSFEQQMILNDAEQKEQVRAFILEMTAAQFVRRSVGQMAGLSYDMIFPTKHNPYRLTAYQRQEFGDKAKRYAELPITIYDKFFEIHQIVNRIRRDAMRDGVRRFYIDYAQKITVRGAKTKLEAQAYASDLISQTAQELNVSIVVLAQVGRAATKNPNGRPEAVDIADCDNWARDCGQLAFLHRPAIDDFHPRNEFGIPLGRDGQPLRVTPAEFLVRLNRFGLGEADVKLGFYGERGAFVSPVLE